MCFVLNFVYKNTLIFFYFYSFGKCLESARLALNERSISTGIFYVIKQARPHKDHTYTVYNNVVTSV